MLENYFLITVPVFLLLLGFFGLTTEPVANMVAVGLGYQPGRGSLTKRVITVGVVIPLFSILLQVAMICVIVFALLGDRR